MIGSLLDFKKAQESPAVQAWCVFNCLVTSACSESSGNLSMEAGVSCLGHQEDARSPASTDWSEFYSTSSHWTPVLCLVLGEALTV